jgi:sugar lactone lactonase YvrE
MTFSPDGTTLALLVNDTVFVYDTVTGREVRSLDILQPFRLNYSPDGQTLIIATMFESRIVLWHLADASTALLKGHERSILFADFTADGATAISLDSGGNLMTWDTRHRDIDHIVPGTEAWLNSAAEEVIVVDRLDTLSLTRYDLKTYAERGRVAVAPSEYVAEFSEDFQYVLLQEQVQDEDTGSMDGTLRYRVLDLKNSTALATIVLERPSGDASTTLTAAAHLIPGQARALVFRREDVWDDASASYSGTAEWLLWDFIAGTLEPYAVLNTAAADAVALNAIGPAGQWVDIALPDPETYSKPQRLDLTTGAPLEFRPAAPATIPGDDTLYAEVLEDGRSSSTLQLKAVATGEVVETITLEGSVYSPNVMIDPQQNGGGGGAISPSLGFFAGGSSSAFYLQDRSSGHILRDFGDDGLAVIGFAENYTRLIAVTVEGVVIYRQDTLESLVAWTCANRYITPLTELQQGFYRITATEGVCSAAGA